jgi:hypothetical protein
MGSLLGRIKVHKFPGRGKKFKKQGFVNLGVAGMTLFGGSSKISWECLKCIDLC